MNSSGTVIVLNGPSACGKTSIQKCLQQTFDEPYMCMGIDSILVGMLPSRYFNGSATDGREVLWCEPCKDAEGREIWPLHFGERGRRVISGIHQTIGAFARTGNNVLVDYILYEKDWLPELTKALAGLRAYFVGISVPIEVLEQRERDRATSPVGHARSHYRDVHSGCIYDLELDTSVHSAEECARLIQGFVSQHEPHAFRRLSDR